MLNAFPNEEEVRKIVTELNGGSACGPDGFAGHFYQICWDIMGKDMLGVVQIFLRDLLYQN